MDGPDQFETDRLVLLRPRLSHACALLRFFADSDAMRYTLTLKDIRACRRHITGHECQRQKNGYDRGASSNEARGRSSASAEFMTIRSIPGGASRSDIISTDQPGATVMQPNWSDFAFKWREVSPVLANFKALYTPIMQRPDAFLNAPVLNNSNL
jgi:hypothetical protein